MGIKHNYDILSPCGKLINLRDLKGETIAIDMMTYIVSLYKKNGLKKWYKKVVELVNKLRGNDIKCICVFDGFNKPPEKRRKTKYYRDMYKNMLSELTMFESGKTEVLMQKYPGKSLSEILTHINDKLRDIGASISFPKEEEIRNVMILLETVLNCEVYIADGEAENLCCYLLKSGRASYVLSEDSDVLLYGATRFLMKFNGETCKLFELEKILAYHRLTFEELFCMCLILGTDYDEGFEGFGFLRGYRLVKNEGENVKYKIPNYTRLRNIFTSSPVSSKCYYSESEAKLITKTLL
jgi:5'-3' exonuclease